MLFQVNFQEPQFRTWCEVHFQPPQACNRIFVNVGIRVLRAICFIDSGNLFSGSFQSQRNLKIFWNLVKLQRSTTISTFHSQSTVLKICRPLKAWPFQICSSAIHDMIIDTK